MKETTNALVSTVLYSSSIKASLRSLLTCFIKCKWVIYFNTKRTHILSGIITKKSRIKTGFRCSWHAIHNQVNSVISFDWKNYLSWCSSGDLCYSVQPKVLRFVLTNCHSARTYIDPIIVTWANKFRSTRGVFFLCYVVIHRVVLLAIAQTSRINLSWQIYVVNRLCVSEAVGEDFLDWNFSNVGYF